MSNHRMGRRHRGHHQHASDLAQLGAADHAANDLERNESDEDRQEDVGIHGSPDSLLPTPMKAVRPDRPVFHP